MTSVIHNLSNEAYHNAPEYADYISSSQLKKYAVSPLAFKHSLDNPTEQTDSMRFGSLFHSLMEQCAKHYDNGTKAIGEWMRGIAIFEPPVNEKTGQPYGSATKAYKEAYDAFLQANIGKEICTETEVATIQAMCASLIGGDGKTSEQVRKLLKWGTPEVSHFVEYEGCKFKFRPDLETRRKIVDYKTIATDDLSERSINSAIAKYGYDISAAFYLFMEHEQSGIWKDFYWVFVSKQEPHDVVMVDASQWTYVYDRESGIVFPQVGAIKMKALLDLHIKCMRENHWPGSEIFIPEDEHGRRIMVANPPAWEIQKASKILEMTI